MGFVESARGAEQPASRGSGSGATSTTPNALKQLAELSPDALLVIDDHGGIVEANTAVANLFGYALEELLGQPVERLLPERVWGSAIPPIAPPTSSSHIRVPWGSAWIW